MLVAVSMPRKAAEALGLTPAVAAVAYCVMVALAAMASAGALDDARVAHQRGDYATEFRIVRGLAEQGNPEAQEALGTLYTTGQGVPQDYVEAVKWFHRAAEQGYAESQDSLARMYVQGQGVPKDFVQAHMWFNLAASRFAGVGPNPDAGARDSLATDMTPAQIEEAQRLAREWRPK